ncbi:MAG TPA: LysR family transcriptional regulator [Steroidobacteraceae bacterium]|jgi:LysR family transcriptional regulator for bpeEF and oprC|nr:LysR family transcriptional regulator [Steroidobacteraceae bacterium]
MNKLHAMQVFVRIVETGGMTRAADSLRMPKATATTLIQQLEAALGVKLLNRTTRRVTVTTDGAAYYPRCLTILALVRETEESLGQRHSSPRGPLRVEVPTLMARLVIVPALPNFFARYPEIELRLGCSERRSDLLGEGIDCAVWSGELEDSTLIARRVGQLYLGTCASPAYLDVHGLPQHPDQLAAHRCINHFSPRTGKIFDWVFAKDGRRIQTALRGHIALDDENSYVAAAEAGLGVAQIPAFVLKDALERGSLELLLGNWFAEPAPLNVVYPQNRHLSSKIRVFVDWVAELFGEHDGIQLRSTLRDAT